MSFKRSIFCSFSFMLCFFCQKITYAFEQTTQVLNDFQVTYYKYGKETFTGTRPKNGKTVAVDPEVIPLGKVIHIQFPNGLSIFRFTEDTGTLVKGKIIDIYSNKEDTNVLKFLKKQGRIRNIKVTIIE